MTALQVFELTVVIWASWGLTLLCGSVAQEVLNVHAPEPFVTWAINGWLWLFALIFFGALYWAMGASALKACGVEL